MSQSALAGAREMLCVAGYGDDAVVADYSVWLGPEVGVATADLVAFGRTAPRDMSTAVITVGQGEIGAAHAIAEVIAAPYFLIAGDRQVDLWIAEPKRPVRWRESLTRADVHDLRSWLGPAAALRAKVGLRQPPLFAVPVDLLAAARSEAADRLGPLVAEALQGAGDALPEPEEAAAQPAQWRHRAAARLVVGALTVLVMRDRGPDRYTNRLLGTDALISRVVDGHPTAFGWWTASSLVERSVLKALVEQLGYLIDYQSLDPAILSQVYEEALVDDDDRKRLGIHYTPPGLARRLLTELPVETVAPHHRHVLDPCCGSGTLLVAAHDRLRDLQPDGLTDSASHHDLAVHLHGYERDPFAAWIARLTLLLHAQPAGNGWQIEELDTLCQRAPDVAPKLIVTNPPWRYAPEGRRRVQAADEFVRWTIRALAPGGLLGILLPASWLSADNSAKTRSRLTELFDVFETWRLPEGTFATSSVATAVLLARKRDGLGGHGARVVREITKPGLQAFLSGDSAGGNVWLDQGQGGLTQTAPRPCVRAACQPLHTLADVLSGPQPLPSIADGSGRTPYLHRISWVLPYGVVPDEVLWWVAYPDDFRGAWAKTLITKPKVLASAARSSNSPWRFRIAVDTRGIAMRNSVRGIAPHDENDEDLLYALAIIVGSGFASAYAASYGGDRNIRAEVLKALPVPTDRGMLRQLGGLGRNAANLAGDAAALHRHLAEVEHVVWNAFDVSADDRRAAMRRLAGHRAPDGSIRYAGSAVQSRRVPSTLRRVGVVLGVAHNDATIWVNGITPDEGVQMPFPAGMPGWLARAGATFDVVGVETIDDLADGRFRFQPMAWQDLDLDSERPEAIVPR